MGFHKILRMPSNSMTRKLCHSTAFCSEIAPAPLSAYCSANLMRFAHSQSEYLQQLHTRVAGLMGDDLPLSSCVAPACVSNLYDMPLGGLSDSPIIVRCSKLLIWLVPLLLSGLGSSLTLASVGLLVTPQFFSPEISNPFRVLP